MIYTTGTVNTVSGSAIVKGTGTKFKNNNPAINIGMTILIKSGNTNIPYMIKSVNSDTELVLAQPALATATNTTFSIHITEPDNNSDAARTMVAINAYTQYFLDAMNTWMTQTGQTKIEMPNGEVITLDSIKKMQSDITNKLNKGDYGIGDNFRFDGQSVLIQGKNNYTALRLSKLNKDYVAMATNENAGDMLTFEYGDAKGAQQGVFRIPKKSGTAMAVGDYGFGNSLKGFLVNPFVYNSVSQVFSSNEIKELPWGFGMMFAHRSESVKASASIYTGGGSSSGDFWLVKAYNNEGIAHKIYTNVNTIVDPQGFIKKASPVINIQPEGTFTTNDESEGAIVTRVAQGEYLIEGVLGFNADAGWGGVDGGIEIPLDVNKQPLIWVDSKVNKDGSILVKTYHRTHPSAPEFARNNIDGFNDGDPIDIPDGRFISVRVQMPEQSIYNVRMREMEDAQKAEEERRQKEEEMKEQYGMGKNDVLL
ncbi:phage tail fiber protein [Proteus sp. G2663]|uniref:phage tail fiber protein n=2 Tax=Proteus sp. G2663 TaxID=2698876 RepID=UPI001378BDE3|nr:hypothetical protein [Proteus sp. G2663]NBM69764.1 hypothetical protein [Proteus sp. G2663]